MNFTIHQALESDSFAISELIRKVAHLYIQDDFLTDVGKIKFFKSTSSESIANYIEENEYHYWVAKYQEEIVGVIAIRNNKHIFHLFVHPDYHGQGIATQLWQIASKHALQRGNPGNFTVFSSSFAHDMYKKWGFRETQVFMVKNGIRSIPMTLELH